MIETIRLQLLQATFAGWVGRRQAGVIAYLIEENHVTMSAVIRASET